MSRRSAAIALFAAVWLSGCGRASSQADPSGWPTTSPATVGVNGAVLDSLDTEIARGDYGYVDRMLVIRDGKIVFDKGYQHDYDAAYGDSAKVPSPLNASDPSGSYNYFNPWWHPYYRRGDLHSLQSVTKTITSVIIGAAVQRGDFPPIDTPILTFFDTAKVANIDDRKRQITVRHLLTMTGGFDWNESLPYVDPRNNAVAMEASRDWIEYVINRPMARLPGEEFNYSSGETELLAHIFHRATGIDVEEYASRHVFKPLGIERWFWKRTPMGLVDTEGGLYLEARDLARIWQLYLDGGSWRGTPIVSKAWVDESVKPAVRAGNRAGAPWYGLKWWLYPNPADTTKLIWTGSGFGGQFPMVVPERNLVVVFNGWNILPGGKALPRNQIVARLVAAASEN